MTRMPPELAYFFFFGLYLLGSAFSFRDNGSKASVLCMACGVLGTVCLCLLPSGGFGAAAGSDLIRLSLAICRGGIGPAFLLALVLWKQGRLRPYHLIIGGIEVVWFLAIMALLYGLYGSLGR